MDTVLKKKSILLFETQENGVMPITDDVLRHKIKVVFPDLDETKYSEALIPAKPYYRVIGITISHLLANSHTISASAMPPFYQNCT